MPKAKSGAGKKRKHKKRRVYKEGETNDENMVLGGAMFAPGTLIRYKHPQLGMGWAADHPQLGSGFFDSVGNFFKGAANGIKNAAVGAYNHVIKPVARLAAPIVKPALNAFAGRVLGPAGALATPLINGLYDKVSGSGAVITPTPDMTIM